MIKQPTICVITPTIGRPTLRQTLESAILSKGDVWYILQDRVGCDVYDIWFDLRKTRPFLYMFETHLGGDYGNPLRDYAMRSTYGNYFVFLDDDDIFAPNAIPIIKEAITKHHPRPIIFKMINGNGEILWRNHEVTPGNVGGSMFVCPNIPDKLAKWDNGHGHRSDYEFIKQTLEKYGSGWRQEIVWSDDIIIHCRPGGA